MRGLRGVATFCLTLAAACSNAKTTPQVTDYDRSCASVADCAAVFVGDPGCCGGSCPNTAVRTTQIERVQRDVQGARNCSGGVLCGQAGPCPDGRVQCIDSICQLTIPPTDGGR